MLQSFATENPVLTNRDVVIAISQSGETADTLAAVELAKSQGAFVYGICNAVGFHPVSPASPTQALTYM